MQWNPPPQSLEISEKTSGKSTANTTNTKTNPYPYPPLLPCNSSPTSCISTIPVNSTTVLCDVLRSKKKKGTNNIIKSHSF